MLKMQVQAVAEIMNDIERLYEKTHTVKQAETMISTRRLARLIRLGFLRRDKFDRVLVSPQGKEFRSLVLGSTTVIHDDIIDSPN